MIGRTLGRYRVVAKLGQGGMGSVWKAEDVVLRRSVALKLLPEELAASPNARHRLLREARAASALDHPGIATVFDAGEVDGLIYIAITCVDGETVSDRVARGPLALEESFRVAIAAADALGHAHAHGITHRDVTGRNIMIARDGRVVVLDFGLALPEGTTRLTETGSVVGTAAYVAPEVILGAPADARSDLYGLGVVLYEMLTGVRPFKGDRQDTILYAAVHDPPAPPSAHRAGVTLKTDRVVLRALAKDPGARYQTAAELIADLAPLESAALRGARARARGAPNAGPYRGTRRVSTVAEPSPRPFPDEKLLAVLPFRSLGGNGGPAAEGQVFADGLAETVSASLARRSAIRVIPPSASVQATHRDEDLRRVARSLGAELLLSGTVRRAGEEIRVTYSLMDAERGVQVTGDTIDGTVAALFSMEDRLVDSVVRSLSRQGITPVPPTGRTSSRDPAAHEHYLQALGYLMRFEDLASVDGAIALLERLVTGEAASPLYHAALARAYLYKQNLTFESQWQERAVAMCDRALQLDPAAPDVLVTVGHVHTSLGRHGEAIHDFQRALKIRRDNPDALLGLAVAYEASGRYREAEQCCQDAVALRPGYWGGYNRLGVLYFNQGQYERALTPWQRVVELTPDNVRGHCNLGAAYHELGRYEDALKAYHRSIEILPNPVAYSSLGTVHFFMGNYAEAAAMFEKGASLRPNDYRLWGNLADAYRWTPGLEPKAATTFDRAIEMAQGWLRLHSKDAETWNDLAGWLAKRNRGREAVRASQRALKLKPGDVNFLAGAARVHLLSGREPEARAWLARAAEAGYSVSELMRDPELAVLRSMLAEGKKIKEEKAKATGK